MKEIKKSKKGFTLVEVLLSLAIIMMIGGVIAGLCASIGSSFATTYNINDSADYAMLFGKGFENSFLSITQGAGVATQTWTWYMSKPGETGSTVNVPTLMVKDSKGSAIPVFRPQFLNKEGSKDKECVKKNRNKTVIHNSIHDFCFYCVQRKRRRTFGIA